MNRTVGEMAHAMRAGANLDVRFWPMAWGAAIFLRNRCPTTANPDIVAPYQVMFDRVPNLANLFIFESRAEAFVDEALRRKGDNCFRSGLFVGYDDSSRAYKFLPDGERKWILVRSIVCNKRDMVPNQRMDDLAEIEVQNIEKHQCWK
jgi:hypothetical protein